ncbi:hypothetical protein COF68_05190 [Bacillus toyonensis]|uniref:hypothetical protein n=1 Tax=Bacillus toyonensis TaxID=155322 RepID=UPI000BFDEC41|nr:hypothetical protein [Bacillus toyonensis]PHE64239.1 hypothetical protein COF68_05190 [Bacillus toyonensis]
MLFIHKEFRNGKSNPSIINLVSETHGKTEIVGYFTEETQFQLFCQKTGLELGIGEDYDSPLDIPTVRFQTNRSMHVMKRINTGGIPRKALKLRGVVASRVVDLFLVIESDSLLLVKPRKECIHYGWNPSDNDPLDFIKEHGLYNFM